MPEQLLGFAFFLLLNMIGGLWRVLRGPTPIDSMLAAQLFGTTGVAILLLLAPTVGAALHDVALVFALLAAVATVAFVQHSWRQVGTGRAEDSSHE
jgi:multicomponent Na+:H+ antiporter subunit F